MDELAPRSPAPPKLQTEAVCLHYGAFQALDHVTMDIPARSITAIIGPSGCGKSTLLRLFNRMNDLIPGVRVEGRVLIDGESLNDRDTDVVALRKRVGMVFQKPNPFPMSIYDNIALGPRRHGQTKDSELSGIVERSLRQVALWDELKDMLKTPAQDLSVGQQQRLCIARALAVEPEVILMDESCSALDPESTLRVEELMRDLAEDYTILTVTHNMEQAARVSDMSAVMMMGPDRAGILVEFGATAQIFSNPKDKRTEDYITGRFG
jgi:phosphate transport system ATP-binding protein